MRKLWIILILCWIGVTIGLAGIGKRVAASPCDCGNLCVKGSHCGLKECRK